VPKLALAIATLAGSRYAVAVRPNQSCDPPFGVHTGSCGNKGAAISFVPVKNNAAPSSTLPRTLRWYSGVGELCVPAQTAGFLLWGFRHGFIFLKLALFHSSPDRHGQRQPSVPLLFNGIHCDDLNQKVTSDAMWSAVEKSSDRRAGFCWMVRCSTTRDFHPLRYPSELVYCRRHGHTAAVENSEWLNS